MNKGPYFTTITFPKPNALLSLQESLIEYSIRESEGKRDTKGFWCLANLIWFSFALE